MQCQPCEPLRICLSCHAYRRVWVDKTASRSQSPRSLDQRSGERETLVKSRKRQIRWAVEKQFKFPGTVFCFYLPTLLRVSTVEEKPAIYFQKTRTLTVCLLYTVVSRCGLTQTQNTAHARVVIQPEPEFSASGFGSFQSLPHPFRRTRVTEALRIGTFGSDYDYEYEYEFFNVYPVRMPDCVRLARQLVLSSKSRRRLDTNYEIFNKSRPPSTSLLQVQRRVKRLVLKRADTL